MSHEKFKQSELENAWKKADGKCECCGKNLSWNNQGRGSGWGAWEAHLGTGRKTPMILCTGEPENCHLNCGHNGAYKNPGISPRVHKGGRR